MGNSPSHEQVPRPGRASFKIVVRRVEKPVSSEPIDDLTWICQSLGFLEPLGKDNTAYSVIRELMKANDSGEALTSTAIAERVNMSRGSVIHQLNNLMKSGLVVKMGRYYALRSRSVLRTIEEIEEDVERIFMHMKKTARELDEELGILPAPED